MNNTPLTKLEVEMLIEQNGGWDNVEIDRIALFNTNLVEGKRRWVTLAASGALVSYFMRNAEDGSPLWHIFDVRRKVTGDELNPGLQVTQRIKL